MKQLTGNPQVSIRWLANLVALCLIAVSAVVLCLRQSHAKPIASTVLDTKIGAVDFQNVSLDYVIQELSRSSGVAIDFDPQVLNKGESYVTLSKGPATLDSALRSLFARSALGDVRYYADARAVHIIPVNGVPVIGRVYDVRDIVRKMVEDERHYGRFSDPPARMSGGVIGSFPSTTLPATRPTTPADLEIYAMDELTNLITNAITPDWWLDSGGNVAAMRACNGHMFVLHTAEGHRQIESLLLQLRIADVVPAHKVAEPVIWSAH